MNQEFVDVAQGWSPAVLVDLLEHLGPQLDRTWADLDLSVVGEGDVWWADAGVPAPVWLDVAREYSEFCVHQQQIRDALGRPGADDPALLGPVIDTFMRGLPNTLRVQRAAAGSTVRVDVQGPGGGTWVTARGPSRWRLDAPNGRPADALVQVSPDTPVEAGQQESEARASSGTGQHLRGPNPCISSPPPAVNHPLNATEDVQA
jgi:hypothetical protein